MTDIEFNIPQIPKPTHPRFRDLEGQKFRRLTVIAFAGTPNKVTKWYCRCDCGKIVKVSTNRLVATQHKAQTSSCGCYMRERAVAANTSHGLSNTTTWNVWYSMRQRCGNPKVEQFPNYGGRGITVCDRWKSSFENFYADMGDKPHDKSLERVDVNGNYCPENCKWATTLEQANNTRMNHYVTYQGKTQSLSEWCRELKMPPTTLHNRLQKGWDIERAFTQPVRKFLDRR